MMNIQSGGKELRRNRGQGEGKKRKGNEWMDIWNEWYREGEGKEQLVACEGGKLNGKQYKWEDAYCRKRGWKRVGRLEDREWAWIEEGRSR